MMDWNGNGKTDGFDHYVTYEMLNKDSDGGSRNRGVKGSGVLWFILAIGVVSVICEPIGILMSLGLLWYVIVS